MNNYEAVYLLYREDGLYKIGVSANPHKRVSQIASQLKTLGFPMTVQMVAYGFSRNAYRLEKALHAKYRNYWVCGEWFDLGTDRAAEVSYLLNLTQNAA